MVGGFLENGVRNMRTNVENKKKVHLFIYFREWRLWVSWCFTVPSVILQPLFKRTTKLRGVPRKLIICPCASRPQHWATSFDPPYSTWCLQLLNARKINDLLCVVKPTHKLLQTGRLLWICCVWETLWNESNFEIVSKALGIEKIHSKATNKQQSCISTWTKSRHLCYVGLCHPSSPNAFFLNFKQLKLKQQIVENKPWKQTWQTMPTFVNRASKTSNMGARAHTKANKIRLRTAMCPFHWPHGPKNAFIMPKIVHQGSKVDTAGFKAGAKNNRIHIGNQGYLGKMTSQLIPREHWADTRINI